MYTDRQIREIFHFCFLERLLKISDVNLYVLKGGVNLRFFFNSPRYSEDMDLDVAGGSVSTLRKNGYKILNEASFVRELRTYGIDQVLINDPLKAKHTDTTQRFRVRLVTTSGDALPSKIEFSRRANIIEKAVTERVDTELSRVYKKLSFRCRHYPGEVAVVQKINALAGRTVTQARDIFDLGLLQLGGYTRNLNPQQLLTKAKLNSAVENLDSVTYEDYQGHVIEFLNETTKQEYAGRAAWSEIQNNVLRFLINEN